jgi:hypothetical protein
MAETQRSLPPSRKDGVVVGIVIAVILCLGVTLCLGGVGAWGGLAYYFTQSTAQARQTQSARLVEAAATAKVEAQNRQATEAAMAAWAGATATTLAKEAASTATAQTRVDASTATAQARADSGTSTPPASADVVHTWPVRLLDTFDAEGNDWLVGPYKDDFGSVNRSITSGKYRWEANTTQGRLWRVNYTNATVSDSYLAVDVLVVTGDANTRYGLVAREDGQNYYYFDAGKDGKFAFYLRFDDQWTTLVDVTSSGSIETNGLNRLALLAQGDQFTLFINGQLVAQATDSHIRQGLTGIAVNLTGKTPKGVYEFDNFELRAP